MLRSKKGSSFFDVFFIGIVFLILAVTVVVGYHILSEFNDNVQASGDFNAEAKAVSASNKTNFLEVFDKFFLVGIIGLGIGLIVGATLLNTHPSFFLGAIVLLGFLVFFAGVMSNTYEDFANDPTITDASDDFIILPWVFDNYPKILVVIGIFMLVGLFAKLRGGSDAL
jgi:hypothetical protein